MGWRPKTFLSLFGRIRLQRSYYHCQHCGASRLPWDKTLGLTEESLTPAAAQVTAQAGVLASFAEASQRTLRTMCGLRISESTVERTTESAGERAAKNWAQGGTQGPKQSWNWQRDGKGKTCAYVSLDHTGIRRQGPEGHRAEGKMAGVALVYNPKNESDGRTPPPHQVRHVAGFYELDSLGRQLRREAGANALCHLRAVYLSDPTCWNALWVQLPSRLATTY